MRPSYVKESNRADDKHAGKRTAAGKNCCKRNEKISPKKKGSMLYVGMDVHKATIQAAAMDAAGNIVLETNIKADKNSVNRPLPKISELLSLRHLVRIVKCRQLAHPVL